jgi:hypothetical protein
MAGFGFAAGPVLAVYRFRASRTGQETGSTERPVAGPEQGRQVRAGWTAALQTPLLLGETVRLRFGVERVRLEFQECVVDAWALCGPGQLTRVSVGGGLVLGR